MDIGKPDCGAIDCSDAAGAAIIVWQESGYAVLGNWRLLNLTDWIKELGMQGAVTRRMVACGIVLSPLALPLRPGLARAAHMVDPRRVSLPEGRSDLRANQKMGAMKFEILRDSHIVLALKINGHDINAVFDSGAGPSVVDASLVGKYGLVARDAMNLKGLSGNSTAAKVEGASIEFDGIQVYLDNCVAIDLRFLSSSVGAPIGAIIGRDFFDKFIVDIDFNSAEIKIQHLAARHLRPSGYELEINDSAKGSSKYLNISVGGRPPLKAVYDLGCGSPLLMSPDYVRRSGILAGLRTSTSLGAGVEGPVELTVAQVRNLVVGGVTFPAVPVEIPPNWNRSGDAVIGLPVLRRFRNVVDFHANKLFLQPDPNSILLPFSKDRSGIGARFIGDALKVVHVAANSPAAQAGLSVGDEICAINGNPVSVRYLQEHPRQGELPAGTVQNLTLRDGSVRVVVLAEYY